MSVYVTKYKTAQPQGVGDGFPSDGIIHEFGYASFGATADSVELELTYIGTVLSAAFTFKTVTINATDMAAGEYLLMTDGVVTSGAITVVRGGHTNEGAVDFYYDVWGTRKGA